MLTDRVTSSWTFEVETTTKLLWFHDYIFSFYFWCSNNMAQIKSISTVIEKQTYENPTDCKTGMRKAWKELSCIPPSNHHSLTALHQRLSPHSKLRGVDWLMPPLFPSPFPQLITIACWANRHIRRESQAVTPSPSPLSWASNILRSVKKERWCSPRESAAAAPQWVYVEATKLCIWDRCNLSTAFVNATWSNSSLWK